jgi:hypothetical protein
VINLSMAKDWHANIRPDWESDEPTTAEDHLPVGAIFQDLHIGPEMIVLPVFGPWNGPTARATGRIAISRYSVGKYRRRMLYRGGKLKLESEPTSRLDALVYCDNLSQKTARTYRLAPHLLLGSNEINEFGVSLHDGEGNLPLSRLAAEHFRKEYAEWCSDDDAPIYMTNVQLMWRAIEKTKREIDPVQAGFHLIRELVSGSD